MGAALRRASLPTGGKRPYDAALWHGMTGEVPNGWPIDG